MKTILFIARAAAFLFGLCSLLAFLLYALFPSILPPIASYYAAENGWGEVEISLTRPGAESLRISEIGLIHPKFTLKAENTKIFYNLSLAPSEILRSLSIENLKVTADKTALASSKSGSSNQNLELLIKQIPFKDVSIKNIEIQAADLIPGLSPLKAAASLGADLGSDWKVRGQLKQIDLLYKTAEIEAPAAGADGSFIVDSKKAELDFQIAGESDLFNAEGKAEHSFEESTTVLNYQINVPDFSNIQEILSRNLKLRKIPLHLKSGEMSAQGRFSWGAADNNWPISIALKEVSGSFNNFTFTGLKSSSVKGPKNSSIQLNLKTMQSLGVLNLYADSVDVGIPLTDVSLSFETLNRKKINTAAYKINKLKCSIFSGTVLLRDFLIDPHDYDHSAEAELSKLDIAEILLLYETKGIEGSGLIDGKIPISIGPKGFQVKNGVLNARAPGGRISIDKAKLGSLAESNPKLALALKVLENYQYSELKSKVSYDPDGNLALAVSLKGKNPNVNYGQAVNVNVNVEENLPALLRSLRLADEIGNRAGKMGLHEVSQ